MLSASGRFVVVLNGEIYNFKTLRAQLEGLGHRFLGTSDTEVILAAFEQWGVDASIPKLAGMFALAVWDQQRRRLFLIRDRFGKKPLYYGSVGAGLVFGSELKALRQIPGFRTAVDRQALTALLERGYVPSPLSIYAGAKKVPPGSYLTYRLDRSGIALEAERVYWSPREVWRQAQSERFQGSLEEAKEQLRELLTDAVKLRMVADVPIGAFLSGGIDSSLIVALMQRNNLGAVRTFSIGFRERVYDEASFARRVSEHLGTQHQELYVSPEEAMSVVPELPTIYDEPFADVSQIPTYLMSKLARRAVTVALSGDGGDELFGGYERHIWARAITRLNRNVPRQLRIAALAGVRLIPTGFLNVVGDVVQRLRSPMYRNRLLGEKLYKLSLAAASDTPAAIYENLTAVWPDAARAVLGADERGRHHCSIGADDPTEELMIADASEYLPDDVLVKVDRASMAVSLEARAPLLDHRLFEFATRLPLDFKVRGRTGKIILRNLVYEFVPRKLVDRTKTGFGVPIDSWLRGPLRDWAEELLGASRLARDGYLDPASVRAIWNDHLRGHRQAQHQLWSVLMFNSWLDATARS
jgi:asparagine synthase (glutamine-hydrolysing)